MTSKDSRQKIHFIIGVAVVALLVVGCTGGTKYEPQSSDFDIKQVTELVMTYAAEEPERALEVIDSLRAAGLPDYQSDLLRVRVYSQGLEGKMLDSAIVIGERLMDIQMAKDNLGYREDVLEALVNACRQRHDDERVIRWSSEMAALCREYGEETVALRNEAEMGLFLTHVGRQAEGVSKIDGVLATLDNVRKFNELDAWVIAAKRKIAVLREGDGENLSPDGQADVIPIAQRIIDRLTDYEQHPEDYRDGTYREPSGEDRQGYIDFYRAQAYGYMAEAYARNGESQKAFECLEKFEQSDYGQTLDGRKMIAPTWCLLGETQKLDAMYEDLTTARFRDYEQKMEIERQKAEASLWHIITWLVVMITLLLACFAVYYYLRHREEKRKNRILARQITEAMDYKEKYLESEKLRVKSFETASVQEDTPLESMSSAALFAHISQVIVSEKLFLEPTFDRQAAIDYFHLSKERIGAAFSQGSDYTSISDFINECRLEYAVNLINDQPSLPISQVAQACGFSDANYFGRKFKARFGLSPSQYRSGNSPELSDHS